MGHFERDSFTALAVTHSEVFSSGRMKYFLNSDGEWELGSFDFFVGNGAFRKPGFEENKKWVAELRSVYVPELDEVSYNPITMQDVVKRGIAVLPDTPYGRKSYDTDKGSDKGRRRAMTRLFDYVRCNWDLDCMFTLTFDKEKINRTSYEDIVKKVGEWFSNRVRRAGLKYIAVPEFHADGEAIHFHGMCNFSALKTAWSGKKHGGKRVYNITDFPYGFTAVKRVGKNDSDRHAVSIYVAKYITKDTRKVGGRYYLHGGKFTSPRVIYCDLSEEDAIRISSLLDLKRWETPTPNGGTYIKYEVQHSTQGEKIPL